MSTSRLIRIGLILTSLICYLEWGGGNSSFLFQAEYGLFADFKGASSFMHPLIIIPMVGQLILLYSLFQSSPGRKLVMAGILCIGLLVVVILLVGLLSLNFKIIISTLPFLVLSVYYIRKSKSPGFT